MNILRDGATLYELNNEKIQVNLWSAHVDRGFRDDGTRMSSEECVEIARKLQEAPLLAKELAEALAYATEELESWLRDQGDYGTTGYDEIIPEYKALIKRAKAND